MYLRDTILLLALSLLMIPVKAQNYQAIHGSPYAGSLSPAQNPAAIVHVPYPWDLTLFAVQAKHSTNAFKIEGLSFFSVLAPPDSVVLAGTNGVQKHFLYANQDIHLLNARVNLNPRSAVAFGANVKNYFTAESNHKVNFQDTILLLSDFMRINFDHQPLSAQVTGAAWAEIYGSFGHTIVDDGNRILNAGVTLKAIRALAGATALTSGLQFTKNQNPGGTNTEYYTLTDGTLRYGYSANFDLVDTLKSASSNRKAFLKNSKNSFSADLGMEYIMLADEELDKFGGYAYETKIGISIMDLGKNNFTYGSESRVANGVRPGVADSILENRFFGVNSLGDFNDSLAGIVRSFEALEGSFAISQPTRLLLNIDQHIKDNFFINAEATIPLKTFTRDNSLKELSLLALTPRWELKSLGLYLPFMFNSKKQFWVGGAVKAGPVLLGTHNLGSLFSKNKIQRGGLYLAVTLRPSIKNDRQKYLPGYKPSKKELKELRCPKF